jgi:hypothetical protein
MLTSCNTAMQSWRTLSLRMLDHCPHGSMIRQGPARVSRAHDLWADQQYTHILLPKLLIMLNLHY